MLCLYELNVKKHVKAQSDVDEADISSPAISMIFICTYHIDHVVKRNAKVQ